MVLICFIGSKKLYIRSKIPDNNKHMLVLGIDVHDENVILINLCNPNSEAEPLKLFWTDTDAK